jgi:hypothetical protein
MSTSAGMPRDIDRLLDAWFDGGPTLAADRVVGAALAQVEQTAQSQPLWPPRVLRRRSGDGRVNRRWSRTLAGVIATVALLVALIGIGIQVGLIRLPNPNPIPAPTINEDASPDPNRRTSDTAAGTIQWARVGSDTAIRPQLLLDGAIFGYDADNDSWWTTADGMTWTPTESPPFGGAASFLPPGTESLAIVSPDGYGVRMGPSSFRQVLDVDWVDEPGDATIYARSGEEWEVVTIPPTAPRPIDGARLSSAQFDGAALLDDSHWIVPAVHLVDIPWSDVLGSSDVADLWPIWNEEAGILEIFGEGLAFSDQPAASLTVQVVDGAAPVLEFRDASSGRVVHRVSASLPGWTPQALLEGLRGWGLKDVSFLVRSGGDVTVVRPPWTMGEDWTGIVTSGGRYYVASLPLGPEYSATAIHLWESDDGLTWTGIDVPRLWDDVLESITLASGPDGLVMMLSQTTGSSSLWSSSDGRDWSEGAVDPSLIGDPEHTSFGWLMNAFDATAISVDGRTWEGIELPPLPGEPVVTYLGGVFFYGPEDTGDEYATWVGVLSE